MSKNDAHLICLDAVITVQECATIYHKNPSTVVAACLRGKLAARQSEVGATWLISRASASQLWKKEPQNG
jgi:hypothetical protein